MELKGKKLVFLGDSITYGTGKGFTDASYVYWRQLGKYEECEVHGYGVSGSRIAKQQTEHQHAHITEFDDKYFRSRVPEMEDNADIVVVLGGSNDYGHGDAALGKMEDRTDDTFYGALHCLYSDLLEKYPKATIVIMTPPHCLEENKLYNGIGLRNQTNLEGYVNIIKEVAAYYSFPVLDLYRTLGINPQVELMQALYMPDGVHPSNHGHTLIYRRLKNFLENL